MIPLRQSPTYALCGATLVPTPGKRGYHCPDADGERHRAAVAAASAYLLRRESGK